jgi:uncharacterized protein YdaL
MRRRIIFGFGLFALACTRGPCHPAPPPPTALVLYDDGELGELYGTGASVVMTRFGGARAEPVSAYRAGEMRSFRAVLYIGSTPGKNPPRAFLDDVAAGMTPTIWLGENIEALASRGFVPGPVQPGPFESVTYKNVPLARAAEPGLRSYVSLDSDTKVLAVAKRDDGSELPWALRHRRLTYIGENPFAWVTTGDRFLAFTDLLFDDLAPKTTERHRALARIEDVSPYTDPAALRALAQVFVARHAPFAIALIPVFVDPGASLRIRLSERPALVAVLRELVAKGATLVLHGYTHQRTGVTGEDYEFFADDDGREAGKRVERALEEVSAAGLPRPRFFEFPHYSGSAADARVISRLLPNAFQRETVFGKKTPAQSLSLTLPFAVDDPCGFRVVPENLGYFRPETPNEIVANAHAVRVVRDSVAGFFFHPTFEPVALERIMNALESDGWTFTSPERAAIRP